MFQKTLVNKQVISGNVRLIFARSKSHALEIDFPKEIGRRSCIYYSTGSKSIRIE